MSILSAELVEVPRDENEIPLPIIPSEDFPKDIHSDQLSKHHEYFLPGSKKFGGLGPVAVRGSRILRVERIVHNDGPRSFHRFYDTSPVPYSEQGLFDSTILSAAGYMPRRGIDLWGGTPMERPLEAGELAILTEVAEEDRLRYKNLIYYTEDLRSFYDKFLQRRNLAAVPPDLSEAFISAKRNRIRSELGHEVLESLVEIATRSVIKKYDKAYKNGQLHPNAPADPTDIVLHLLGRDEQREKLFRPIRNRLASLALQARAEVVPLQA